MKPLQNCETVNSNFWKFWKVNFEYRKGQIENQIRKVEILIRTSWRLKSVKLNIESDKFIIESGKLNIESGKSNIEYFKLNIKSEKIEYRIRTSTWQLDCLENVESKNATSHSAFGTHQRWTGKNFQFKNFQLFS